MHRIPGLIALVGPDFRAFFRRDFHPWKEDDRALIRGWDATYDYRQEPPAKRVRSAV